MRATTIAIGVVLLAIAACDHRRSAEAATPDGSSLRPPTTAPGIYFTNLAGQIEAAKVVLARDPASVAAHRNLSALTYVMGRYHGELDEIQRAIDHASAAIWGGSAPRSGEPKRSDVPADSSSRGSRAGS